ncbi:MAG: YitT family protein [Rikenellaceae bacterium]
MAVLLKAGFLSELKSYLIISFGLIVYSFAWACVLAPAGVVGGGSSGIALVIYYATGGLQGGIPMGASYLVINGILLTIALFIIGPKFGAKTLYAIGFVSLTMSLMQEYVPNDVLGLASDKLLSAILGAAASGCGVALCLNQGGSTGGTDIIAMIVNKYRNVSLGRVFIVCDLIIIGSSIFVLGNITAVIYGYVTVGIFGYAVDLVLAGTKQSTQLLIISKNYGELADNITNQLGRGVTVLDGMGWYSKEPSKVIMVVCRRNEIGNLYRIIKMSDKNAFITSASVASVYGKGFEDLKL